MTAVLAGAVSLAAFAPRAQARELGPPPPWMLSALQAAPAADAPEPRRASSEADDPPRTPPIPRSDPRAEAEAAEKQRKAELAAQPAYKRWWFWALTAVVVGGTAALGVWLVDSSDNPARKCSEGVVACFGDGRR
jgi:uncharacterized membrane protein